MADEERITRQERVDYLKNTDSALIPYLSTENTPDLGICFVCKKPFNKYYYYYKTEKIEEYCQCGYPNDNKCFECGEMLCYSLWQIIGVCGSCSGWWK